MTWNSSVDMKFFLRIVVLLFLVTGIVAQGGFDLADAFDDDPTPAPPKVPEKPKANDDGFDLGDAFDIDPEPKKPKKPVGGDTDPKPDKPAVDPPKSGGGGGGSFDDSLLDVAGGEYKPDGGRSGGAGGAGRAQDNADDAAGDQPQEAGTGQIAGIASAIGVAILGAASSYFAYQKKKLCFKLQGGADPESGKDHHGTQSEPQVLSNLLRTS